jgi:hypothetical protein
MVDYTYEDYRHAIISTGDAMLMDLSYNWNRKLFNRKMNMQIIEDKTLTSDNIHSIMVLANSYLESNLFLRLMGHNNFDKKNVKYFIDKLNHSPVMTEQFYKNIIKYDLWNDSRELSRATMQQFFTIDREYLMSERAIKEAPGIVNDLMYRYEDDPDSHRKYDMSQKIAEIATDNPKVMEIVMRYFEETGSETYLPDNAKELFLF